MMRCWESLIAVKSSFYISTFSVAHKRSSEICYLGIKPLEMYHLVFLKGVPNKHPQVGSKTARGTITCNNSYTTNNQQKTQNASWFTVNFRTDNETAASSFHFIISIHSVWIGEHMKRRGQWFGTRISNWTSNSVLMEMCQQVWKTLSCNRKK